MTARAGGGITGILPLVEQSSVVFGRYLISVPYLTYGGLLSDDSDVSARLAARAAELGRERRAGHVELRQSAPVTGLPWAERLDKVSMVLELPDSEQALGKMLGSKLRSQIKRAERETPEVVWGGLELVQDFYEVFASSMHQLGTPVYPRRFFEVVCRALTHESKILVVRKNGAVAAAALVVRHGSSVEVPWAAATVEAKRTALNMRMYWEMLVDAVVAVRSGGKGIDQGRTYKAAASNPIRFQLRPGEYEVEVSEIRGAKRTFNVSVASGEVLRRRIDYEVEE